MNRAASVRDHRAQHRALVARGYFLELATCAVRLLHIADHQQDLEVRGQQPGAFERIRGLAEHPADRGQRGIGSALGEPKLGKPGLGLPSVPARLPICLLCAVELPQQPLELRLAVERQTDARLVHRLDEALPRPLRLLERIRPGSLELQDLRAVHEATACERLQVRLPLAPAGQGGGPLPRAAHLVHLLQREDHPAVDDSRDSRRQLARGHRHHRLVEESKALLDPTRFDQHLAAGVTGERKTVRIAEALGDRHDLASNRGRACEVACCFQLEDSRHEQVAPLDAVRRLAFEQPFRSTQPAASRSHLPSKHEGHPDPEGTTHGVRHVAGVEVRMVTTLE